jgi:hypothetical protein
LKRGVAFLCAWFLPACCAALVPASPQESAESSQAQTIHGVVINSISHEPIGRALVSSTDNRLATMTDSQGRFEFVIPGAAVNTAQTAIAGVNTFHGTARATVSALGITTLTATKPGFLADPNDGPGTVQLNHDHDITLSLVPEALITGRVMVSSYDGATPVQVQLYKRQVLEGRAHWVPAGEATARANGEFRFAELYPGIYKLFTLEVLDRDPETFTPGAQLYGYPPIYFPAAHDFASAATIRLEAGKTFQADLSPIRQAYYRVKVPVGNAVPGAPVAVTVMPQGHRGPGFSLGYNDRDRSIEGMLPNGVYALEAASYGPSPASGTLTISVRDAAVDGPTMMLVSNASITVNVRPEFSSASARSGPLLRGGGRYFNIRLEPADDFGQGRAAYLRPPKSPQDTSLVIDSVAPGRYWVRVDSSVGFASSITSGALDLLHHPLIVAAGASAPPIEITLRDDAAELQGTIEAVGSSLNAGQVSYGFAGGTMYTSSSPPAAYIYCVPLPDSTGQFVQGIAMQDGEFNLSKVPPGAYQVLVFARQQPELEYEDPDAMRAYDSKGLVVRLVAGQKEHVRLPLAPASE